MTGKELKGKLLSTTGLKLTKIAEKLKMTKQSLNQQLNVEDVKSGLLEKICSTFDISICEFFEETKSSSQVISKEALTKLSKDELVTLVKDLMDLHSRQTEMYNAMIQQNNQMIRLGQERLTNITNIIFKNA